MCMISKYPWRALTLLASKRLELLAANSLVVQAKSLGEVLQEVLCHMIQVASLALRWPWKNSLDLWNLFHYI